MSNDVISYINNLNDYERYKNVSGISYISKNDIDEGNTYEGKKSWLRWHIPGGIKMQMLINAGVKIPFFNDDVIEAESISIDDSSMPVDLCVGESYLIDVNIMPSNSDEYVSFTSSNESVLKVEKISNKQIKITPLKVGNAKILMKTSMVNESLDISVDIVLLNSISIKEKTFKLDANQSVTLTPVFSPSTTTETDVQWISSDTTKLNVSYDGTLIANNDGCYGDVDVTAYVNAKNGKISTTISGYINPVNVSNITVVPSSINFVPNYDGIYDSVTLSYTIDPLNASWKDVTFTNNDSKLFDIDDMVVSANMNAYVGDGIISLSCGPEYTKDINVTVSPVIAYSINVENQSMTLNSDEHSAILYDVYPSNTYDNNIIYTISGVKGLIDVDDNGIVHANNEGIEGESIINMECGYANAYVNVKVNPVNVEFIEIVPNNVSLSSGITYNMSYVITPSNATHKEVKFSLIEDTDLFELKDDGTINVNSYGLAGISYVKASSYDDVIYNISIITIEPVMAESIKIAYIDPIQASEDNVSISLPSVEFTPSITTDKTISFSIDDKYSYIAYIEDDNIVVNDLGYYGDIILNAKTTNNVEDNLSISILPVLPESIELNTNSMIMNVGDTFQLECEVYPEITSNKDITYKSSDDSIVSVDKNGLITALFYGNVTISAICGEITKSINIYSYSEDNKLSALKFTKAVATSTIESVGFTKVGSPDPLNIEYFVDGISDDWTSLDNQDSSFYIAYKKGSSLYIRGNNTCTAKSNSDYWKIIVSEGATVSGNLSALVNDNDTAIDYEFAHLFHNSKITDASGLILLGTTAPYCYASMFINSKIVSMPELVAKELSEKCYLSMFSQCTKLTSVPDINIDSFGEYSCQQMFNYCTAITSNINISAKTLASNCCYMMFSSCKGITNVVLPNIDMVDNCYNSMFNGCTSLNNVTCLNSGNNNSLLYTSIWLNDVSSTGTFTKLDTSVWSSGTSGIPTGWTIKEVTSTGIDSGDNEVDASELFG